MSSGIAGVVLAAGAGTRLRPLTDLLPKALCPVDNRPLVDWALDRFARLVPYGPASGDIAVNVHHHRDRMAAYLGERGVHLSIEADRALGTAGALGQLRDWLDGRDVLITNADTWFPARCPAQHAPLAVLVEGWDGERPRLLCSGEPSPRDFGAVRYVGSALLPWWSVRDLLPEPSGLYEASWRALHEQGRLDLLVPPGVDSHPPVDCGTPASYLAANLAASGGRSVVGAGAVVEGVVVRSVVWPGARVERHERLVDSIRVPGATLGPLMTPM